MPANGDNKFAAGFVSSKPARQNPQLVQKSSGKLAGMRFLIVEDEPLVALELVDGLTVAGVDVVASVGESKEALDVIESSQFDAALLDGNLNGQRVDEIAAALTRHCVPFAFVSGYGRDSLPLAFREVALLNKPFSQSQVLETAERLITPGEDFIPLRKR
jgi:CheY-like chemotaxis protein